MRKLCSAIALLSIGFALGGSQLAIAQTPFYKQTNLISDDKSVIDALQQRGIRAWRTDVGHTITLTLRNGHVYAASEIDTSH